MTQTVAQAGRKIIGVRMGTSPKTLHRKAMEKAASTPAPDGEGLEELFPQPIPGASVAPATDNAAQQSAQDSVDAADGVAASADQAAAAPAVNTIDSSAAPTQADESVATPPSTVVQDQSVPSAPALPPAASPWSDADERAYQALAARRKAAGFQRRGRDVSAQRITVGAVSPNPGTVVADIVGLVAARGAISRGELLDLMATATFAHPKGKGGDRGWSQGYVSGALASGFLAQTNDGNALGERSPDTSAAAA